MTELAKWAASQTEDAPPAGRGSAEPYRTASTTVAEVRKDRCELKLVSTFEGGQIYRNTFCPLPGFLTRLLIGIKHGDSFTCGRCGSRWVWSAPKILGRRWLRFEGEL